MEKKSKKIYLGLDIGTDSVGYAVTDDQYNLLRVHGDDAWGSVIFDAASLSDEEEVIVLREEDWTGDSKE